MFMQHIGHGVARQPFIREIPSTQNGFALKTWLDTLDDWDGTEQWFDIWMTSGIEIGSTSTSTPAFQYGSLPGESTVEIGFRSSKILGPGGQGASMPTGIIAGTSGSAGGNALEYNVDTTVKGNSGTLGGGGGGGGQGGQGTTGAGGAGGGGAGIQVGPAGTGAIAITGSIGSSSGSPGTETTGGAGGAGGGGGGTGGRGGSLGVVGSRGSHGTISGGAGPGAGGAAGKAANQSAGNFKNAGGVTVSGATA